MFIIFAGAINSVEQQSEKILLLLLINGVPITCYTICFGLTAKHRVFAETLGPALLGSYAITMVVLYNLGTLDQTSPENRSLITGTGLLYYCLYLGILNVRFL